MYDFDHIIDRYNTNAIKYDYITNPKFPADTIPMWVADMDFAAPPEVLEDIKKAVDHGVFGYSMPEEGYYTAITNWFERRHGFHVQASEIVNAPGVVYAIAQMIQAFTEVGDAVLIQTPVYHPFREVIQSNRRKLVTNSLVHEDNTYTIDFGDFEDKIIHNQVKLFIFCNPHNPVGRVWKRTEIERINEICEKHQVLIISDEIHCEFIHGECTHESFWKMNDQAILTTAPSKTFNLAGLQVAQVFIKDKEKRNKLKKQIAASGYGELNTLGLVACQSAYEKGEAWITALNSYLQKNISFVREYIKTNLPMVKLVEPEGSYLLWLDFSEYDILQEVLEERMYQGARVFLSSGTTYGVEGYGFFRMNIACPRVTIAEALDRIQAEFTKKVEWIHLDTFQHYGD